ncbi:putative ankyrin repeat and SAM domain-containing protein 3 isoform X1 [Apostichopus japonicus]|uniref:Putative ankyrin repeat and SAM domain-containing protein 3 isoform X1 n=1 Tax=Stichopus japonicus TaxID=307972 RepID=A0A2G8JIF1_STIJA|nr:putative ankyrin repeat and SAM domain-containing protein 3 isoform X1 [Apostichopus japonicus]
MEQPLDTISDEASSESDFLDKSLSMWIGWNESLHDDVTFDPIPLDLHTAASLGDYDFVKELLARPDTDPNRKNRGEWTPLMYASYIGHDNIVNLLLDAKVDVNIGTESGTTPLMLAASCGNESVAYFLHQNGAKLDIPNERGWTALFHATYSGHLKVVQLMADLGADIHRTEFNLRVTPLMLAAAEGHETIVNYLLEKGVDVKVKNKRGDTARSLAMLNGNMNVVALIDNINVTASTLRSEPDLNQVDIKPDLDLSSSDESFHPPNRPYHRKGGTARGKGPSIQDGPAMFARMQTLQKKHSETKFRAMETAMQHLNANLILVPESGALDHIMQRVMGIRTYCINVMYQMRGHLHPEGEKQRGKRLTLSASVMRSPSEAAGDPAVAAVGEGEGSRSPGIEQRGQYIK